VPKNAVPLPHVPIRSTIGSLTITLVMEPIDAVNLAIVK
jgi:hypothetical protein